jgi:hypothetical protein
VVSRGQSVLTKTATVRFPVRSNPHASVSGLPARGVCCAQAAIAELRGAVHRLQESSDRHREQASQIAKQLHVANEQLSASRASGSPQSRPLLTADFDEMESPLVGVPASMPPPHGPVLGLPAATPSPCMQAGDASGAPGGDDPAQDAARSVGHALVDSDHASAAPEQPAMQEQQAADANAVAAQQTPPVMHEPDENTPEAAIKSDSSGEHSMLEHSMLEAKPCLDALRRPFLLLRPCSCLWLSHGAHLETGIVVSRAVVFAVTAGKTGRPVHAVVHLQGPLTAW